ncbi:MAG TPA: DinB family protein [Roseiflexaceae bacterium]|nr:DinB family protein [Roseiflexaceae bacterium]
MPNTAEQYTTQLTQFNDELLALARQFSDGEWAQTCQNDERSVGAVVHHVAATHADFLHIVEVFAAGQTYSPRQSQDDVHAANARQSQDHSAADRHAVLDALHTNGAALAARVATLDGDLERAAGVYGGHSLSVAQVLEWIVIGHIREHLDNLHATFASA